MQKYSRIGAIFAVFALTACAGIDSDIERGIVGAGFGCVAGEALARGACVPGAIAGGAGGVLLDDVTGI